MQAWQAHTEASSLREVSTSSFGYQAMDLDRRRLACTALAAWGQGLAVQRHSRAQLAKAILFCVRRLYGACWQAWTQHVQLRRAKHAKQVSTPQDACTYMSSAAMSAVAWWGIVGPSDAACVSCSCKIACPACWQDEHLHLACSTSALRPCQTH